MPARVVVLGTCSTTSGLTEDVIQIDQTPNHVAEKLEMLHGATIKNRNSFAVFLLNRKMDDPVDTVIFILFYSQISQLPRGIYIWCLGNVPLYFKEIKTLISKI